MSGHRTWKVIQGHVLTVLGTYPKAHFHCVVTSPPYWGLRDYGLEPIVWGGDADCEHHWGPLERGKRKDILPADQTTLKSRTGTDERQNGAATNGGMFCQKCSAWLGCLGLEPTPDLYVEHMVTVFREIRRVLRPDGTLWLNIGRWLLSKMRRSADANNRKGTRCHAAGTKRQVGVSSELGPRGWRS